MTWAFAVATTVSAATSVVIAATRVELRSADPPEDDTMSSGSLSVTGPRLLVSRWSSYSDGGLHARDSCGGARTSHTPSALPQPLYTSALFRGRRSFVER